MRVWRQRHLIYHSLKAETGKRRDLYSNATHKAIIHTHTHTQTNTHTHKHTHTQTVTHTHRQRERQRRAQPAHTHRSKQTHKKTQHPKIQRTAQRHSPRHTTQTYYLAQMAGQSSLATRSLKQRGRLFFLCRSLRLPLCSFFIQHQTSWIPA